MPFFFLHCPTDYSGRLKLQIEGSKLKTNWALRAKVFWGQLRRLRQRNNCFWIPHYPAGGAASSRSARVLCCDPTLHPTTFTYCAICQSHLAPFPTSLMTTNPFPFVSCWWYFSEAFRKHLQTLPVGFCFFFKGSYQSALLYIKTFTAQATWWFSPCWPHFLVLQGSA